LMSNSFSATASVTRTASVCRSDIGTIMWWEVP
jgi:hypothetical protein